MKAKGVCTSSQEPGSFFCSAGLCEGGMVGVVMKGGGEGREACYKLAKGSL